MHMTSLARALGALVLIAVPAAVAAQLALPGIPPAGRILDAPLDALPLDDLTALRPVEAARRLADARVERLTTLVRRNRGSIEFDEARTPAVKGVLLVTGASESQLATATRAGFTVLSRETIEGIDLPLATLRAPAGLPLARAQGLLRRTLPGAEISADNLYEASGPAPAATSAAALASGRVGNGAALGLIDGGVAVHPMLGAVEQRGFARGAPLASAHGTAVASLLTDGGALLVADVYGRDPAGGSASAIARALGWMLTRNVSVVTVSLVGPPNPLLERAVAAATARGLIIVAAVGNDGPAAPPGYPASWGQVVAVSGVDRRERLLIEARRSPGLDYVAPGADLAAARPGGGVVKVRGTSYAAPFVARRLAAHYPARAPQRGVAALRALDREARDLGPRGPDPRFGRGLVCGGCASRE